MEMLTAEFKSTPQDGLINSLYFGSCHLLCIPYQSFGCSGIIDNINYSGFLADYVKCLECHNIRHKPEEFLILPLPIRKPNRKQLDEPTLVRWQFLVSVITQLFIRSITFMIHFRTCVGRGIANIHYSRAAGWQ